MEKRIIGVRVPDIKKYAKELVKKYGLEDDSELKEFLGELPHKTYEEMNLHGCIICLDKDYDRCIKRLDEFLPYVDNWATCDSLRPVTFQKHKNLLLEEIHRWIKSSHTYAVRFAIEMLMTHFLDDDFNEEYLDLVCAVNSEEYYIKMMVAWYMATALAKQYDSTIGIIEEKRLENWTHNKAIQKAIESYRVSDEHKKYLRTLKI